MVDVNEDDVDETILVTHEISEENIWNDNVILLPEDEATTSYGNLFVIDTTASTANEMFEYDDILDMLDGSASNSNELDKATNTAEPESACKTIRHWLEIFDPNVQGNNTSEPSLMQFF